MQMIKRTVDNAKLFTAFLMHLQVVGIRKTKNVRKITEKRSLYFLLHKCLSLEVVFEILYLRRWSRIFEKLRYVLFRK